MKKFVVDKTEFRKCPSQSQIPPYNGIVKQLPE